MRILFVNLFYYPNMVGGTEHSIQILAENLVKHGHDITVVSFDGYEYQNGQYNGVNVYRINDEIFYKKAIHDSSITTNEKLAYYLGKYFNSKIEKEIINIIKEKNPDIVHTNNFFPARIWKYASIQKCKVVHTIRDYYIIDPRSVILTKKVFINLWHKYYEKYYSEYVDIVTAPSQYVINTHLEYGFFENCIKQCVPNAISINPCVFNNCINEKMTRNYSKIRFLYVGALTDNKGIVYLLECIKKINNSNIQIIVCGDGPLREYVEGLVKCDNRIEFLGKLGKEALDKEYMKADVLLVPSLWPEPFGRIIIEGAYFGLPSIATDRGGIPEIIKELRVGDCFDPNDDEALIKLVDKYTNRENIKDQIQHLSETIKKYDIENQISAFVQLYSTLI